MIEVVFTNNHYATAHEALVEANKVLAANGLPLFTYGSCGGGGSGNSTKAEGGGGGGVPYRPGGSGGCEAEIKKLFKPRNKS